MPLKPAVFARIAAFAGLMLPTLGFAQTSQAYSSVRSWIISSEYQNGAFIGCHGQKNTRAETLAFRTRYGQMEMVVPNEGPGTGFAGALVQIDRSAIDAQFGFEGGYAFRALTDHEIGLLKKGSRVQVRINGQYQQEHSLKGSTAALLKIQECESRKGQLPKAKSAQAAQPQKPAARAPQSNQVSANCDGFTFAPYRCTVTRHQPEAGYIDTYEITDPNANVPSFFFKIMNRNEADVWVAFDGGAWNYVGVWINTSDECSEPAQTQTAEARMNLGQDAWGLCVR
jgi:hypothetical protein